MSEIQSVKLLNDENGNLRGYKINGESDLGLNPDNRHYQMVQDWIAEGNTPEPADPLPQLTYAEQRAAEYPPIDDQLDALFHAGVFPDDMAAKIQAVKDKYPKS